MVMPNFGIGMLVAIYYISYEMKIFITGGIK